VIHILNVSNISVNFGAIQALNNVSLSLDNDADITGIIGPNGAGKSTFLSVIAGEIKPNSGTIQILGKEVKKSLSPETLCELGIARTFQIPRPFNGLTVEENVIVSGLTKMNLTQSRLKAKELMKTLNLEPTADLTPGHLNLAGRKRLELAKALMTQPKILLLDELFEGLNEVEVDWMVDVIKNQIISKNIKVIMVEHVISALRKLAKWLYVLDQGKLIAEGMTNEVLSSKVVIEAYLGKKMA
jgi:branched-chain amino acid transport system ATP-binding protein